MHARSRFARCRPVAGTESVEEVVDGPEDAVSAVRSSMAPTAPPQLVFLFCDTHRVVRLAVSVSGAGPADAPRGAECLLSPAADGWVTGIVVGLVLPGDSTELGMEEVAALLELSAICDDVGLEILEVVVIAGSHSRSILSLVVGGFAGGNNGDQ